MLRQNWNDNSQTIDDCQQIDLVESTDRVLTAHRGMIDDWTSDSLSG